MDNKISLSWVNIEYLRRAFSHFFPEDTIYAADKPFESGEFNWKNRADFIDFVYRLTGVSIKSERDLVSIKKAQLAVEGLLSESTIEEKPIESNLPDKEARENLEAERQLREDIIQKSKSEAEASVRESVEKKQEIYKSHSTAIQTAPKDVQKNVLTELNGKTIYAVPVTKAPEIVFTENEQKFIEIAKNDPQLFAQKLSTLIIQKNPDIPTETLAPLSQIIAVDATKALLNPTEQPIPVGVVAATAKAPEIIAGLTNSAQSELAKTTSIFTAFSENKDNLYRTILLRSVGENVTNTVLGPAEQQFTLSTENVEGAFVIKLDQFQNNSFSFQESDTFKNLSSPAIDGIKDLAGSELKNFAFEKTKSLATTGALGKVSSFANSKAFDSIAPFLGLQTNFEYVGTNLFGKVVTKFFPQFAPLFSNIAGKIGINIGIKAAAPLAADAAIKAGGAITKGVLSGALGKVAVSVGLKGALTAIGQSLGSALPIVGNALAFIVTSIVGKIAEKVWPWIKKNASYIIGAVMGLGAYAIAGPVVGVVAGVAGFGLASAAAGGTVSLGAAGASIAGLFKSLGLLVIAPIATPILITILVVPIIVAFILFIINSGAYIVPPTATAGSGSNPYIQVEKSASPGGPFQNSNLPLEINYNVTITAKKSTLRNISITDDCQIINASGSKKCPLNSSSNPQIPSEIVTSGPYSYSYKSNYSGNDYKDSLVTNTIIVSADTTDGGHQETLATATVKIGNPPEDCPNGAWPVAGNIGINLVTQGPLAPSCSHRNLKNAIDIGIAGEPIVAVNSGIATVGEDSCVGKYVKITSTCGSTKFSALYGHLGAVSIKNGQKVTLGQSLGISDNTGSCTTGSHLHFEFQTASVPTVQKPYLIRSVPVGCCTTASCNP